MDVINEEELVDYIIKCRRNGKTSEEIRTVLQNLLASKLDELLPLSNRILEAWYNAIEVAKNQK